MKNRSAKDSLKGYFYQLDHTIIQLLTSSPNASITVEGIEDVDLDDNSKSAFIQCKYYEGTEYNHSKIKNAIVWMIEHFHDKGCPNKQVFKYRLYGHFKSGQEKLNLPLTRSFLKNNFLTSKKNKTVTKVHEKLSLNSSQLDSFLALLEINLNAPSYEIQEENIIQQLKLAFTSKSDLEANLLYARAITAIKKLAVQADEEKRKITRSQFFKEIDNRDLLFDDLLYQKFSTTKYAKMTKKKFFTFHGVSRMPKRTRIFVIDMKNEYDVNKTTTMLVKLSECFSNKEREKTPQKDRFCPYVVLRELPPENVVEVKKRLWHQGIKFFDGYPFKGADFSEDLLATDPTSDNGWKLKFIPSEQNLSSTVSVISSSIIEIFDLYKSTPLDSKLIHEKADYHPIKSGSSFFIQEVIQA